MVNKGRPSVNQSHTWQGCLSIPVLILTLSPPPTCLVIIVSDLLLILSPSLLAECYRLVVSECTSQLALSPPCTIKASNSDVKDKDKGDRQTRQTGRGEGELVSHIHAGVSFHTRKVHDNGRHCRHDQFNLMHGRRADTIDLVARDTPTWLGAQVVNGRECTGEWKGEEHLSLVT